MDYRRVISSVHLSLCGLVQHLQQAWWLYSQRYKIQIPQAGYRQKNLQFYLDRADSLYGTEPEMRKYVLETEAKYKLNMERPLKADLPKAEAKELEKAARDK